MWMLISVVLAFSLMLAAQETRRETVHPSASAAQDSKPNSDQVPDAYAIRADVRRIIVLRFKYDTDLLAGLKKMVEQEKINNAVILSGVGSVKGYQVHQVINGEFPIKEAFVKNPNGPADIIGMSGFVIKRRVHPHITLSTPEKAFGGHLEPETKVFTFAIVTLGILDDEVDLSKIDDWTYR